MSLRPSRPFRTMPRAVSAAELDVLNHARPAGLPSWEPYEVVRERMASEPEESVQIVAWVTHPDERVVLAALADDRWGLSVHEEERLQERAYEAAMRTARADGLAWTPVLDRLLAWDLWPGTGGEREWGVDVQDAFQVAHPLTEWLEMHAEADDVEAFVGGFVSHFSRRLAARYARVVPPSVLDVLIEGDVALELSTNPALPEAGAARVLRDALERCAGLIEEPGVASARLSGVLKGFAAGQRQLGEAEVDLALELIRDGATPSARRELAALLSRYRYLPPSRLRVIFDATCTEVQNADVLTSYARGRVGLDFWRHVARSCPFAVVHETLAEMKDVREDRAVRDAIIERGCLNALQSLLEDVTREEFGRIMSAMLKASEEATRDYLETLGLPKHLSLQPTDLTPLLEAGSSEIRLIAMTHLAETRSAARVSPRVR